MEHGKTQVIINHETDRRIGFMAPPSVWKEFGRCVEAITGKKRQRKSVLVQFMKSYIEQCEAEQAAQAKANNSEAI